MSDMSEKISALKKIVRTSAEKRLGNTFPCADVRVYAEGKTVLSEQIGFLEWESRRPLPENAMFRLASMTKPVTASAVMLSVQDGLLSLDDRAEKYIPEFAGIRVAELQDGKIVSSRPSPTPVTVKHLLTHTSGLGSGVSGEIQAQTCFPREGETLADLVPAYGRTLLEFEPGTSEAYSGLWALDTLARIVELVNGTDFPTYCRKRIFEPLGMKDASFSPSEEQWSRFPVMYARENGGLRRKDPGRHVFENLPLGYFAGGAGLTATGADYVRFAAMLLEGGKGVLRPETIRLMSVPQIDPRIYAGRSEAWGLGMRVILSEAAGIPRGSFGWSGAYGTHFWIDPKNRLAVVYLSNRADACGAGDETAREIERDVYSVFGLN